MRDDVVRRAEADDDAVVRQLWDGPAVRRLARDLSQIAAGALLRTTGPVRPPGSARTASRIVERRRGRSDVASIVKEVERATLHLSHPRYISQQVAAPIPAAALVESVVAAMNQSLAV